MAREFKVNESTIRSTRAEENNIRKSMALTAPLAGKFLLHAMDPLLPKMEDVLHIWILHQNKKGNLVGSHTIKESAKTI